MENKKKIGFFGVCKAILTWLLVLVAVGMMIFTVVSGMTFDRNNRDIFGYKFFIDLTDSMSPDYFSAGDVVIVKEVKDMSTIQAGDIITYQSLMEGETYGKAVTHMVRSAATDAQGNPGFITYGVATGKDDSVIVTHDFVLGKYVCNIPSVGYFFQYLKTPIGYVICILVPFLLLIGMQGITCVKTFRKYKKEQMDMMETEKAQLQAEREESQKMMQELIALKAQLAKQSEQAAEEKNEEPPHSSEENQ